MLKQTHTILVVDDESTSLLMLEKVLRTDYTVITARSGAEALKVLKREPISLLITDQRMPGMTGTELLRESQSLRPGMVSILLTSNNDTETFIDAITRAGALRVMNKPWDSANLLGVVEKSLKVYEQFVERKGSSDRLKQMQQKLDRIAKPL
jgi:response regulator RpfG family c-di-GMP phosphodiesterase